MRRDLPTSETIQERFWSGVETPPAANVEESPDEMKARMKAEMRAEAANWRLSRAEMRLRVVEAVESAIDLSRGLLAKDTVRVLY